MTGIADISVPTDSFMLGRLFDEHPESTIEFEQVVPFGQGRPLLFWIHRIDPATVQSAMQGWKQVDDVTVLSANGDITLFEVNWVSEPDQLSTVLTQTNVQLIEGFGTADSWDFRLRFRDQAELVSFNKSLTEAGIPVTLQRLSNSPTETETALSNEQFEAVKLAHQRGYFDVPRRCTIQDLAEQVNISDSAFSQRLRRGVGKCIGATLDDIANSGSANSR